MVPSQAAERDELRQFGDRKVRRRAWVVTLLLVGFMVVNFADKVVLGIAGVEIKTDLGLSHQQFGLVQSSFFWLFAVGATMLGWLGDKIRARWLLAGLMLVWCVTLVPLVGQ